MAKKALRCLVEIDVKSVTCPGTWLPKHEDIYISVTLFSQVRRTHAAACTFPLIFHDHLKFDKVFRTANNPTQIADVLDDSMIRINLIQLSEMFSDGRLLAYYEASARDFLYPYPSRSNSYSVRDRELLLERTVAFPGINPRLEFSTKTVVEEMLTSEHETWQTNGPTNDVDYYYTDRGVHQSRSRTRSPSRMPAYGRSTVSSAIRYRSPSPVAPLSNQMRYLGFDDRDDYYSSLDNRPPFVVRKVERDLIERRPSSRLSYGPQANGYYRRSIPSVTMARYGLDSSRTYRSSSPGYMRYYDSNRPYSSGYEERQYGFSDSLYETEDSYRRRSASPSRYLSKLRNKYDVQFDDCYWSPQKVDRYHSRTDRGLRRNRSLERIDRSNTFHGYTDKYLW